MILYLGIRKKDKKIFDILELINKSRFGRVGEALALGARPDRIDTCNLDIMGWHVPRLGEIALQAVCEEFDSLLVHIL